MSMVLLKAGRSICRLEPLTTRKAIRMK